MFSAKHCKKHDEEAMDQNQFVNARGSKCPGCGSESVRHMSVEKMMDGVGHTQCECDKCGATWVMQFAVCGFANFKQGKRKKK